MLNLFRNRNYRIFVFGYTTSSFGNIFLNISFSLYVLKMTGSATKFGSMLAIALLPKIIIGFFSGALVDKLKKKRTVILLDFVRCLFLIILSIVSASYVSLNIIFIYITVLFFSLCDVFFVPSFTTILPRILKKDEIVSGNAMNHTIVEIVNIATPVIAALFFSKYGLIVVMIIDAITYLMSGIAECFFKFEENNEKVTDDSFFKNILTSTIYGFKYTMNNKKIISLVVNGFVTHLILLPFIMIGVPYLLLEIYNTPDSYYGVVESFMAIGAISALIFIKLTKNKFTVQKNINIGIISMLVVSGFFFLIVSKNINTVFIQNQLYVLIFFCSICFLMFLSFRFYGIYFVSYYQKELKTEFLGRFCAILLTTFSIGRFLGFRLFGYLFQNKPLHTVVTVLVIGMFLKIIVHLPFLRSTIKSQKELLIQEAS